jgi:hypothetical protein
LPKNSLSFLNTKLWKLYPNLKIAPKGKWTKTSYSTKHLCFMGSTYNEAQKVEKLLFLLNVPHIKEQDIAGIVAALLKTVWEDYLHIKFLNHILRNLKLSNFLENVQQK